MAERTPAQFSDALALWRKGLRSAVVNATRGALRRGATRFRRAVIDTTPGRRLWGKGSWQGKAKGAKASKLVKMLQSGASHIPITVSVSKARWSGDELTLGWSVSGMAKLISEGGTTKRMFNPRGGGRGGWHWNVRIPFRSRGIVTEKWAEATRGIETIIDTSVAEYTRKAGL